MPLPPALAARLAKRGIIRNKNSDDSDIDVDKAQEEIIAEDYDDKPQPMETSESPSIGTFEKFHGWFNCPNKWNVYHECNTFCCERWIQPKEINPKYSKCRNKLLLRFPLPAHWQEVLDSGMGRYYYWNTETDLVTWLPPGHPKCQVSRSAAELRKLMIIERNERLKEEDSKKDDTKDSDFEESSDEENIDFEKEKRLRDDDESSITSLESLDAENEKSSRRDRSRERSERERARGRGRDKDRRRGKDKEKDRRSRRRHTEDTLDPMDPAAYSDCPRGNWASGLPERDEARTGVDSTASGPLFQMRPYPNPGAVLRANAQAHSIGPKKT